MSTATNFDSNTRPELANSSLYKDILELVLLCTVNEEPSALSSSSIYLADMASLHIDRWDMNQINQALHERLHLSDLPNRLILSSTKSSPIDHESITESRCLHYISGCYQRLFRQRHHFQSILDEVGNTFLDYTKTAMILPNMYDGQDLSRQWMDLLIESRNNSLLSDYINHINDAILSPMTEEIENLYKSLFRFVYKMVQPLDYFSNQLNSYVWILNHLAKWPVLVQLIFRLSHPKTSSTRSRTNAGVLSMGGKAFEDTLIGSLLSKTCLPSAPGKRFLFFNCPKNMSEYEIELTNTTIWQPLKIYQDSLSQLFKSFVKNPDARNSVLTWIGDCLVENQGKKKEWSSHDPFAAFVFVSDGFLLNLNAVLLDLTKPFAVPYSPKLLKIDPFYAISQNENVHLKDLYKETSMIIRDKTIAVEQQDQDTTFNFITEIFFMSHFSYALSVQRLFQILMKVHEEVSRINDVYNEIIKTQEPNSENATKINEALERCLTVFFNLKAVLTEPYLLELSSALVASTCSWLVHIAADTSGNSTKVQSEEQVIVVTKLPLASKPNPKLSYIPEFLVENIIGHVKLLGRFCFKFIRSMKFPVNEYINFILVFMGDATRLRNPHLRASLADVLEIIIPNEENSNDRTLNQFTSHTETVFQEHPLIGHLSRVLLDVFVSIELTGQAVAFEQKFQYRLPMYKALEYLWKFNAHREQIKNLAQYAEQHIDDAEAPLFLRFINLLINDANFLLDEALTHMARLKEDQEAKDHGKWDTLSEKQRQEAEQAFIRQGHMARFSNIMGMKTLIILEMLTQDIKSIFCQPAICERLAVMLNYFLKHLVGPKRRNLKVRDLSEYLFDPTKLVAKVTDIYLNLSDYGEFHVAVSNDGMSYNEELLLQAVEVLQRIKHPSEKINEFLKLSQRIKQVALDKKQDDAAYDDAPDEFLDPITDELMNDPVMLPSSRTIVDRTTIARHLLSDQTDPFNRSPLHMQDVIPQLELKQAIKEWKASKRQ